MDDHSLAKLTCEYKRFYYRFEEYHWVLTQSSTPAAVRWRLKLIDHDGLTDKEEAEIATNPRQSDTDDDGFGDGWEVANNMNPNVDNTTDGDPGNDPGADPDEDGLTNYEEYLNNTNPFTADSDGDNVSDLTEIAQGSNPMDGTDQGLPPPSEEIVELPFSIGGDWAAWEMTVTGISGADTRVMKLRMFTPDDSKSVTLKLHKGNSYSVTMSWLGSGEHTDPYWYCWEAKIGGLPTANTFYDYSSTRRAGVAESFSGPGWFVNNTAGLLTSHVHMNDDAGGNVAGSLTAVLHVVKVEFEEDTTTKYNFSPSLGEEANIKVKISPSFNYTDYSDYYFKLKIVRKTDGGGEQLIDWVDVGDPHYTIAAIIDFENKLFAWNGIPSDAAGSSASQVQGVDEFAGVNATVKRELPAVTQGQPVPPPLYTAVAGIYRSSDQSLFCEASHKIFVPQVVLLQYDTDAADTMKAGKIVTNGTPITIVSPMNESEWSTQKARIKNQTQQFFDVVAVNIKVIDSDTGLIQPYSLVRLVNDPDDGTFGSTESNDFMNANPNDEAKLMANGFIESAVTFYSNYQYAQFPFTHEEMSYLMAKVAVHETCHTFGLVYPGDVLGGDSGWHNPTPYSSMKMMNPGGVNRETMHHYVGRDSCIWTWNTLNIQYLQFVLPKE